MAPRRGSRASVSFSVKRLAEGDGGPEGVRIIVGSRTAVVPTAELDRMFDPVRMVQESLIDIGPAVKHRLLNGERAIDLIHAGRADEVLTVIESLDEGTYT